jgi:hypothetical protein
MTVVVFANLFSKEKDYGRDFGDTHVHKGNKLANRYTDLPAHPKINIVTIIHHQTTHLAS